MQFQSGKLELVNLRVVKALLSFLLPVVLLTIFLVKQLIGLDFDDLTSGFSHPLIGYDHLLTMLAVGIWAAQLRGHAIWQLPLTFVAVMSLGGLAGACGIELPLTEGIILLSCTVFSILITRRIRFSNKVNVLLVAFFAFFHGYAHGQEISASASLISYTVGFMLATLLLHGAGILVAKIVILAVSCLFAMLVSTTSQAGFSKQNPFRSVAVNVVDFEYQNLSSNVSNQFGQPIASHSCADGLSMDIGQNRQHTAIDCSSYLCLIQHYPIVDQFANAGFVYSDVYQATTLRPFKAYFPDINQTPGKTLLSNGVGLNSPPVFTFSISAPASFSSQFISSALSIHSTGLSKAAICFGIRSAVTASFQFISTLSSQLPSGFLLAPLQLDCCVLSAIAGDCKNFGSNSLLGSDQTFPYLKEILFKSRSYNV